MSPEKWELVKEIVSGALDLPADERFLFVDSKVAGDRVVLAEVISLLRSDTGVLIRQFKLEKLLGFGGFAQAWLAENTELGNRKVVVKVLNRSDDPWVAAAFARELELLAKIHHPGIVQPLGYGTLPGNRPYMVLEYFPGQTLRNVIDEGGLTLARVANLIRKAGAAVEAAHHHNVLHCDLKPANIIVTHLPDGSEEPRLIDFGIARTMQATVDFKTTIHIAGTLNYMPPEQLAGKPTKASDLYSLAVIAYELLTGTTPYPAADVTELVRLQEKGADLPRYGPDSQPVPEAAARVLVEGLASDPASRPVGIGDFTRRFAAALTGSETPRRRSSVWLWAAGFLLILASVIYLARPTSTPRIAPSVHTLSVHIQQTGAGQPAIRDGTYIVDGPFRIEFRSNEPDAFTCSPKRPTTLTR